jgi:hypothetical protein
MSKNSLPTLLLIIIFPWITMLSVMGLHHGLNFPKKSEINKIVGTYIYDGSNDDPGWREHDWDGELVSINDKTERYAISCQLEKYFEVYTKRTLSKVFNKPLKAELIIKINSDDQVSFGDGDADLIWGIKTNSIDTNSIDGIDDWYYSSWKYTLRFWIPLITLIIILLLARDELKQKNPIPVAFSIFISASIPVINAVWYYLLR